MTSGAALPISVIIPTRDTRDLTRRCLAALAASSRPPAEVFVIDDGSRDGTREAVGAAFPHTAVIEQPEPRGFTASINAAWPRATGAIVLLLNSDTEVAPSALARIADAFQTDASLGIAGATLRHPDGRLQWSAGREPTPWWLFIMSSGLSSTLGRLPGWRRARPESQANGTGDVPWVPATAMAVRREVQADIGIFDAAFPLYAQDLDYCYRARAAGWRVAQLADVEVMHVGGATIAGSREDGLRQDPAALFADLARWLRKSQPPRLAARGRRALQAGCAVRLVARQLLRRFRGAAARDAWDRDTDRYRAALAGLEGL